LPRSKKDSIGEINEGNALIRGNFNINPDELDEDTWARLFSEAVWLERWRLKNQSELLASLFGGKKTKK
jgi:hypothetical protein